eukprot:gb/GECG01014313.1/.p1 GENE.gb/GECG01014313.1/~~gb/GECG01014313.1/.p1  ORF type:complete len:224 (+),score=15.37 gb/GECG01014313.1/:1-672(+)
MVGKQRSPFFGAVGLVTAGIGAGWIHYHYFDETRQKQLQEIRERIVYPPWQEVPPSSALKETQWFCVASVNSPWYQKRLREVSFRVQEEQKHDDILPGQWSATAFMYGGKRCGFPVELQLQKGKRCPMLLCNIPCGISWIDSWRPFRSDKEIVGLGEIDSSGLPKWILLNDEKQPERLRVYATSPVLTTEQWNTIGKHVEKQGYETRNLIRMPQRHTSDSTRS